MLALATSLILLVTPPAALPATVATPDTGSATSWQIDPTHSELLFRIRHLVGRVTGTFTDWEGSITGEPADWSRGAVSVVIRSKSISTNNQRRDTHLRSDDFFATDSFPEITFVSTGVAVKGEEISLTGDLTMRGRTRRITLNGTYNGITPGNRGRDRVGFAVSTKINRLDYGVAYNRAVEGGGVLLGDEVTLDITIEAVKVVPGADGPGQGPPPPQPAPAAPQRPTR